MRSKSDLLIKTFRFTLTRPMKLGIAIPLALAGLEYLTKLVPAQVSPGGYGLLGLGFIIYAWSAYDFARGEGTPSPKDPPKVLVSNGLYRVSRNPMFIGVGLMIVGIGVLFRSAVVFYYAANTLRGFHHAITTRAEAGLREKYGLPYEEYTRRVPRWFPVPFLRRWCEPLTGYGARLEKTPD